MDCEYETIGEIKMKKIVLFIFLLLMSNLSFAQDSIIGKWDSVNRSLGGLGSTYEFNEGGQVSIFLGPLVDFSYQIENNQIIMRFADSGEENAKKNSYQF